MKQCHDASHKYTFPVPANDTLSEKTPIFMVIGSESLQTQRKWFTAGRPLLSRCAWCSPGKRKQDERLLERVLCLPFARSWLFTDKINHNYKMLITFALSNTLQTNRVWDYKLTRHSNVAAGTVTVKACFTSPYTPIPYTHTNTSPHGDTSSGFSCTRF